MLNRYSTTSFIIVIKSTFSTKYEPPPSLCCFLCCSRHMTIIEYLFRSLHFWNLKIYHRGPYWLELSSFGKIHGRVSNDHLSNFRLSKISLRSYYGAKYRNVQSFEAYCYIYFLPMDTIYTEKRKAKLILNRSSTVKKFSNDFGNVVAENFGKNLLITWSSPLNETLSWIFACTNSGISRIED